MNIHSRMIHLQKFQPSLTSMAIPTALTGLPTEEAKWALSIALKEEPPKL